MDVRPLAAYREVLFAQFVGRSFVGWRSFPASRLQKTEGKRLSGIIGQLEV